MGTDELASLAAGIRRRGLKHEIVLLDGQILDGRNRYLACQQAGVEPRFVDYVGDDPVGFIATENIDRRHMNPSQRAMTGADIKSLYEEQARARQLATLKQNQSPDTVSANLREREESGKSADQAAAVVGVSPRSIEHASQVIAQGAKELAQAVRAGDLSVSTAATLTALPVAAQVQLINANDKAAILNRAKEIRSERAQERRAERIEKLIEISQGNAALNLPQSYPVIYADPPWRYEHAESESRAIENQYPTMTLEDICALPVADIATEDAILFLWATSPKLAESMRVIESWGFEYRTCAVWDKQNIGMGYYFRQRHELLLVATRGSMPTPEAANRPASIYVEVRNQHSAKPAWFAETIERMYPELPKLEMFCRSPRDGWSAWGNQSQGMEVNHVA